MDMPSDVYRLSRKYWLMEVTMLFKRLISLTIVSLSIILAGCSQQQITEQQVIRRAKVIHKKVLTLDTHVDIPGTRYATEALDPGIDNPKLKCDLVKMNKGGMDGVFLAVFVGQKKRDEERYKTHMNLRGLNLRRYTVWLKRCIPTAVFLPHRRMRLSGLQKPAKELL